MIVREIADFIDGQITTLLPDYKAINFAYTIENNERFFDKSYGITIGSSTTIAGTNRAATLEGLFNVSMSNQFYPKKSIGDESLREQVFSLHADIETLYKTLYKRPFATASGHTLQISELDISEPDIQNNLVTITLGLTVQYRVQTN